MGSARRTERPASTVASNAAATSSPGSALPLPPGWSTKIVVDSTISAGVGMDLHMSKRTGRRWEGRTHKNALVANLTSTENALIRPLPLQIPR